jgi:hypothetical protein
VAFHWWTSLAYILRWCDYIVIAFARPRSVYRATTARNFIVGIVVVAFCLYSQTWKSIARHEVTWFPIIGVAKYDDDAVSNTDALHASPGGITDLRPIRKIERETQEAANKSNSAASISSLAEDFHCASQLTSKVAKLAAAASANGKQVTLTMLSSNQLEFFHNWLASFHQ